MSEIELKYAPRKCKHFCCGDCTLDLKSCGYDINDDAVCIEKYNKLKQALKKIKGYINTNRDKWCSEHCDRTHRFCEKRNCYPIRDLTNILQIINEVGL